MAGMNSYRNFQQTGICLWMLLLTGCAQFSQDGGTQHVAELARQNVVRLADQETQYNAAQETRQLLTEELTTDTAVRIALLNNQGLQASLAELGIAEADLVRAGRMPNPFVSFSRLAGSGVEIERTMGIDFLAVLTMPQRVRIERQRFEQVQQQVALQVMQLVANTRRAYFKAVAAAENARYMKQVEDAAGAGADLAAEMKKAGNWSALDAMRQQTFHADAVTQSELAQQASVLTLEELTQHLGVMNVSAIKLPSRLPDLPATLVSLDNPAQTAIDRRLDVQMARTNAITLAESLGLTRSTAMVDAIRLTAQNRSTTGEPRADGFGVSLSLPLFDLTNARSKRAQAQYLQAVFKSADIALRAQSEARGAYLTRQTTYALAMHYQNHVVPLRKQISDETLLRYNGMLVSVFELLIDARNQIQAVNASIQAQRDYWIAESDWQMALYGGGVTVTLVSAPAPAAAVTSGH